MSRGCDTRPGGGSRCCGSSITTRCRTLAGPPPCIYPLGWTPTLDRCTAGIANEAQDACCTKGCGRCGGVGCDGRPGGAKQCCGGSITAICSTLAGPPPCIYPAGWTGLHKAAAILNEATNSRLAAKLSTNRCTAGIPNEAQDACCSKSCGRCGGEGCHRRPGGGLQCCGGSITTNCSDFAGPPPCIYPIGWTPQERCTAGIINNAGDACCARTCGQCGGAGCESRPGGGSFCCGGSIKAICKTLAGPPPCIYPADWAPPSNRCTAGIQSETGIGCCPKWCGSCSSIGCDVKLGGAAQCCESSIKLPCRNRAGPPPCMYPSDWVPSHGEL